MGPRGDFRHHAAEAAVQIVLRGHDRGQHLQPIGDDRRGRFVAGGFEGEDVHGEPLRLSVHRGLSPIFAAGRTCLAMACRDNGTVPLRTRVLTVFAPANSAVRYSTAICNWRSTKGASTAAATLVASGAVALRGRSAFVGVAADLASRRPACARPARSAASAAPRLVVVFVGWPWRRGVLARRMRRNMSRCWRSASSDPSRGRSA